MAAGLGLPKVGEEGGGVPTVLMVSLVLALGEAALPEGLPACGERGVGKGLQREEGIS